MTTETILELSHITKTFGATAALSDVSFGVRPGEIYVVLGENGAGKTTLFKILAGLYPAGSYTGAITLAGRPLALRSPEDAARNGIGVVTRRLGVFSRLTVAENITVGHWQAQRGFLIDHRAAAQQARAALELVGLKLSPDALANRLSPGQQRLLTIARAVSMQPKIVVLDEPTAFLGSVTDLSHLLRTLRTLAERNIATLYLTHRPSEALQIADRASVLRDGCINGTWPRLALDEATLVQAMPSQRIGDGGYIDHDEAEEAGGILGSLRSIFSWGRNRN